MSARLQNNWSSISQKPPEHHNRKHRPLLSTSIGDPAEPPVVQPLKRIPFSHRDKLDMLLQKLEKAEIIKIVEGPTDWVSNIV